MDRDWFPEIVSTLVFIQPQPAALIGFCWLPWCAFFFLTSQRLHTVLLHLYNILTIIKL